MAARDGIFPTFFLSGFECSTFVWKDQGRRDLCEETQHLSHSDIVKAAREMAPVADSDWH